MFQGITRAIALTSFLCQAHIKHMVCLGDYIYIKKKLTLSTEWKILSQCLLAKRVTSFRKTTLVTSMLFSCSSFSINNKRLTFH